MKALSLTQPWASLVVIGAKGIETRGWRHLPSLRAPLLIHAAKGFPRDCRRLCGVEPFLSALKPHGLHLSLPTGGLLGIVEVTHAWKFCGMETIAEPERSFGDHTMGRIGIRMEQPRRFTTPIPFKGALGFFDVPDGLLRRCRVREDGGKNACLR